MNNTIITNAPAKEGKHKQRLTKQQFNDVGNIEAEND